jgi:hypothetical protein
MYVVVPLVGSLLLVGAILVVVFAVVRRGTRRRVASLVAQRRVVRRSGDRIVTLRFRKYRSARMYALYRLKKNYGEVVLLDDELIAASGLLVFRFTPADIASIEAWVEGETLHLKTAEPPDAEGELQISVRVPDAADWTRVLRERGARLRATA